VDIPGAQYAIHVQAGLLQEAGPLIKRLAQTPTVALVTDSNLAPLHAPTLLASLESAGLRIIRAVIPAGEGHKTLADATAIYDALLGAGIERSTLLLSLGGGVVGDMAGFVAATVLRGIPFVQIPTTLLAMVDASIGGKTGVNHPVGKNLIGAFHQPKAVLIDPAVLKTLPSRELRGGLAECIKHEIIRDEAGFARLEENIARALEVDVDYLSELVAHNVAIKAAVVQADPFETGDRAHLNFGHTFGHAIETLSGYSYSHGEAVALGMVAAGKLAVSLGMIDAAALQRIKALIAKAGLPTGGLTLDTEQVLREMMFDKKVRAGRVRFVLPVRLGSVVIRDDAPARLAREAIDYLRG